MTSSPKLPALKGLCRLSDCSPIVAIDTREQTPLVFSRLQSVRGTLITGDYSVAGLEELFAVERKSIEDLTACCVGENRERFERELHRLRGYHFARLLVIGSRGEIEMQRYRSKISPKSVLGSLGAWEVRYLPVVFAATPQEASQLIERWVWYYSREVVQRANALWRGCSAEQLISVDNAIT